VFIRPSHSYARASILKTGVLLPTVPAFGWTTPCSFSCWPSGTLYHATCQYATVKKQGNGGARERENRTVKFGCLARTPGGRSSLPPPSSRSRGPKVGLAFCLCPAGRASLRSAGLQLQPPACRSAEAAPRFRSGAARRAAGAAHRALQVPGVGERELRAEGRVGIFL
jgi:hypothetical protein